MIYRKDSDLLTEPVDGIIHQANCFNTMGSGIAYLIKQKYPEAYEADCKTKSGDIAKLGTFSYAVASDGKYIFNCYSQFKYGRDFRQTNYEAVYKGLESILAFSEDKGLKSLGLPKNMGCMLGGGDWRIFNQIIEVVFEKTQIDLYICNYDKK